MHLYYGKYIEKTKAEIDKMIVESVDSGMMSRQDECDLNLLLENHAAVECLLHKEMAGKPEAAMTAAAR